MCINCLFCIVRIRMAGRHVAENDKLNGRTLNLDARLGLVVTVMWLLCETRRVSPSRAAETHTHATQIPER